MGAAVGGRVDFGGARLGLCIARNGRRNGRLLANPPAQLGAAGTAAAGAAAAMTTATTATTAAAATAATVMAATFAGWIVMRLRRRWLVLVRVCRLVLVRWRRRLLVLLLLLRRRRRLLVLRWRRLLVLQRRLRRRRLVLRRRLRVVWRRLVVWRQLVRLLLRCLIRRLLWIRRQLLWRQLLARGLVWRRLVAGERRRLCLYRRCTRLPCRHRGRFATRARLSTGLCTLCQRLRWKGVRIHLVALGEVLACTTRSHLLLPPTYLLDAPARTTYPCRPQHHPLPQVRHLVIRGDRSSNQSSSADQSHLHLLNRAFLWPSRRRRHARTRNLYRNLGGNLVPRSGWRRRGADGRDRNISVLISILRRRLRGSLPVACNVRNNHVTYVTHVTFVTFVTYVTVVSADPSPSRACDARHSSAAAAAGGTPEYGTRDGGTRQRHKLRAPESVSTVSSWFEAVTTHAPRSRSPCKLSHNSSTSS